MIKILFVCMGNICRSPTAEAVFHKLVEQEGLQRLIGIDSAGTHAYHTGSPPDRRAAAAAAKRGYDLTPLRARQVGDADFERFDYVLAMDRDNLEILIDICPQQHQDKLRLFMEFSANHAQREVPDPYYGGAQGFENVLTMVEDAAQGLLKHLRSQHLGSAG